MSFIESCNHKVIAPEETDLNILPGKFNNLDAEAAIKAVEKLGISSQSAIKALETFILPEGRLEEIKNDLGINIFIDFAHTPESLEAALTHLRTQTEKKLIAVFGCAGERDPAKRARMAEVSVKLADLSIFTAEDPRSENVYDILATMSKEATKTGGIKDENFFEIPERGEAIAFALSKAKKGDVVVLAGKGHEKSMAYGGYEHPWSDREFVTDLLNSDKDISAIILAAGRGTRMKSDSPKVLREICGRPMISYTLENLRKAGVSEITEVVGFRKDLVMAETKGAVKFAVQKNPKGGTGDAVRTGLPDISKDVKSVMVLYGDDTAFYTPQTISKILELHEKNDNTLTFITLIMENPLGLGRIIRDNNGKVLEIIEEKDATDNQRKIKEVNDGLYIFNRVWLEKNIDKLVKNSLTGEFYINELIRAAILNEKFMTFTLPNDDEWQGVNTPEQLAEANKKMAARLENIN